MQALLRLLMYIFLSFKHKLIFFFAFLTGNYVRFLELSTTKFWYDMASFAKKSKQKIGGIFSPKPLAIFFSSHNILIDFLMQLKHVKYGPWVTSDLWGSFFAWKKLFWLKCGPQDNNNNQMWPANENSCPPLIWSLIFVITFSNRNFVFDHNKRLTLIIITVIK